jgi:diacylglycerol kinase family enzyme
LLDVCALPCRTPIELAELFLRVMAGEHLGMEGVAYVKGKHVRVESSEPVPVQLDGDEAGHTPIEVDLLPFRLGFIVP